MVRNEFSLLTKSLVNSSIVCDRVWSDGVLECCWVNNKIHRERVLQFFEQSMIFGVMK